MSFEDRNDNVTIADPSYYRTGHDAPGPTVDSLVQAFSGIIASTQDSRPPRSDRNAFKTTVHDPEPNNTSLSKDSSAEDQTISTVPKTNTSGTLSRGHWVTALPWNFVMWPIIVVLILALIEGRR